MKVLHIGKKGNMEKYSAKDSFLYQLDIVDMDHHLSIDTYLSQAEDADFIIADAIAPVPAALIDNMPHLKLIHSEGVAFNQIDIDAARKKHVYVCNSAGMNAAAVAEQTLLLMVGMLKDVVNNDAAVRNGQQIQVKEKYMQQGSLKELADCRIGLIGFGHIAKKTALLLQAYGVKEIYYHKRHPLSQNEENQYHVHYKDLTDLLTSSDIVSLHLPVNESTLHIADDAFFAQMKKGSYLVNTSRGELVNDTALIQALQNGTIKMAGLDTLDHEPVQMNHPLLQLPKDISKRILFSPHIAGISASSFKRSYAMIWEDIQAAANGEIPKRVVNPWQQ